jgi:enediyne biosynthesis protein E4
VNGGAPLLLRNQATNRANWLGLKLKPTQSNPIAEGARIKWTSGEQTRQRLRTSGGSYLSSHDPREILGLASNTTVDSLEISWPSGQVSQLKSIPANRYIEVVEPPAQLAK